MKDKLRSLLGLRWEGTLGLILLSDFHSQSGLSSRLARSSTIPNKKNSSASFLSHALARGIPTRVQGQREVRLRAKRMK